MRGGSAGVGGGYRQTPYSGGIATGRGGRGGGGGGRGGGQRGGYQINCHTNKYYCSPDGSPLWVYTLAQPLTARHGGFVKYVSRSSCFLALFTRDIFDDNV